jgi:uncharacterized damage-inducible protein DinB
MCLAKCSARPAGLVGGSKALQAKNVFLYPKIYMNKQLEAQFARLEADRILLFESLRKHSDEVLNRPPREGAWSVAEVIGHLLTAEELSLKYLEKKMQDTSAARPEGLKNKWRWLLVNMVFTFNIKFKAPEIVKPKHEFVALAELERRWAETRSRTLAAISKLSDEELNKQLWKHAVAGKMNLYHMVEFFGIHFNRHRKQIERTLTAVL